MSGAPVLSTKNLCKHFGGLVATSFDVAQGEVHALIGPNGAGKTTLIPQLQGELAPNSGQILFCGHDITRKKPHLRARFGLARMFQISCIVPEFSALKNVALSAQIRAGHSFRFIKPASRDPRQQQVARTALEQVGLASRANIEASQLSYGERRQVELAMVLVQQPKLLLLDEPMAGLGKTEGRFMTDLLASLNKICPILLVEHDMDAVFVLAARISVLVSGTVVASGTASEIRSSKVVRDSYLGRRQ
jgi:branched-chain amino acid transport system ATP-binding protein